ncbi:Fc.00g060220.m01.CDS01 [Cosmosporella sp. VM-42]
MSSTSRSYQYRSLQNWDVRLVHVHPAQHYDEDIHVTIVHEALIPIKETSATSRLSLQQLQLTLPEKWEVFETPEGRYLFCHDPNDDAGSSGGNNAFRDENSRGTLGNDGDGTFFTTWDHPDPSFDRSAYELPPDDSIWEQKPTFEALSYCWGPEENSGNVMIDSGSDNGAFKLPIRQNLESALRNLRSDVQPRVIWIDAICINQDDEAEKCVQVARMADIYSRANRVIVWLGPAADESDLAISTLAHLGAQVETTLDTFRLTSPGAEEPTWYDINVDLPYSTEQWDAIECLVCRPWFSRVWTAQEIQLANRLSIVQIGNATITWALFRRAIDCLKDRPNHGDDRLSLANVSSSIMHGKGRPLVDILRRHARRQCFMPHDKIYGMLAMVPGHFAAAITPDYSQPVSKTYAEAFVANANLLRRWDLFACDVVDRTKEVRDAPSWVPDFYSRERHVYFSGLLQFAAGNSQLSHRFVDSDKFEVLGVRCAVVESVGFCCPSHPAVGLKVIRSWEPSELEGSYVTGGTMLQAFAITLLQNDLRERHPTEEGWPTLAEWRDYCQRHIFKGSTKPHRKLDPSYYLDDMVQGRCANRVFMTTKEGYIGLGPRGCQVGDVICVIPGCNVPVVLRSLDSGRYNLVGDSFVYGLNDAQALLGRLPSPWRVQIFDHPEQDFRIEHRYFNEETKELTASDPRLEENIDWERVSPQELGRTLTGDDPLIIDFFRHKDTGDLVNSDPRLLPATLRKQGVNLEWLILT